MSELLVADQFEDAEQQQHAATLGMWTFLATEVLFFGGALTGYAIYRHAYPSAFAEGSRHLYKSVAAINTALLLTSSLCMALAVRRAMEDFDRRSLFRWLLGTIAFGGAFLLLKAVEYGFDFRDATVPVLRFDARAFAQPRQSELFLIFYFALTLIHALHMIVGIGLLSIVAVLTHRGYFDGRSRNFVEGLGLYWHFVDAVWVVLLPLLYLIR